MNIRKQSIIEIYIATTIIVTLAFKDITALARTMQIGLYLIMLPEILPSRYFQKKRLNYNLWAMMLLCYSLLSVIWASYKDATFTYWISLVQVALIGICVSKRIKSSNDIKRYFIYFATGCLILGIRTLLMVPSSSWGTARMAFEGYHVNGIGNILTYGAIVFFILLNQEFGKKSKLIFGFGFLLCAFVVFMTSAKKNMIVLPIIVLLAFTISQKNISKLFLNLIKAGIVVLIICLLFGDYFYLFEYSFERLSTLLDAGTNKMDASTAERMLIMTHAVKVFKEDFWLGCGLNNFRFYNPVGYYAHNNYLEIGASLGILGIAIYYSIYLNMIRNIFQRERSIYDNIKILCIPIICCILLLDIVQVTYYAEYMHILLGIVSASLLVPVAEE